jgi:DNA-binding protein HU-beta
MNKGELIERIAEEAGVPEGEAQKYFCAFERVVTEALKSGEEVRITGFGSSPCGSARPGRAGTPRPARK